MEKACENADLKERFEALAEGVECDLSFMFAEALDS